MKKNRYKIDVNSQMSFNWMIGQSCLINNHTCKVFLTYSNFLKDERSIR